MITYQTKTIEKSRQLNKVVELIGVSKKYPLAKMTHNNIRDDFKDHLALRDVSCDVYQGEVVGIIGRNGAGKTTLLNIIAGILPATPGEVRIKGRVLGLLNLGVGFQDELTGRENIFLNGAIIGAARKELKSKLNSVIDFSELGEFIDLPLGTYSQGMRLRLGFSIIANLDCDILVIDEVLAVGDVSFQSKCFQRLMDFKRAGKTLIITTQDMNLIERLCDRAILLDHGQLLYQGNPLECINRYHTILNTEKFFVGPMHKHVNLFENTKKWTDSICDWGKKLGTKETKIDRVELINRFGLRCNKIKAREALKVKVYFTAQDRIKQPHFGVAIFRNDGVYCFGPNTEFDGYKIPQINIGKGWFVLHYRRVLLAPGEYRISVAIWDKNETLAFDYHNGYYTLIIKGDNRRSELLHIPFKLSHKKHICNSLIFAGKNKCNLDLSSLDGQWQKSTESKEINIASLKLMNADGEEKQVFITNEPVRLRIDFTNLAVPDKNSYLWVGLYRDDQIYCQEITALFQKTKNFIISFPKFFLLPGSYRISVGIWDNKRRKFIMSHHGIYQFRMVFTKEDHGTVYLEHKWKWRVVK